MSNDFLSDLLAHPQSDIPPRPLDAPPVEVPTFVDTLPDGKTHVIVYGDITQDKHLYSQGENIFGYQNDCGLVSCETIFHEFGKSESENAIVAHAVFYGECEYVPDHPDLSGKTSCESLASLLTEMGVPSHGAQDYSLESLAERVESGHGTIIGVNCGHLWDEADYVESGYSNHAVAVIGVARDQITGEVVGFYINDSGRGLREDAGRFVSSELMEKTYIEAGGQYVTTDDVRPNAQPNSGPIV